MHSILDVAKYILEKKGPMTTMKLQKLCYYSQAWSLAWDETPLFNEDFEAWANGPVCPTLFYSHKGHYSVPSNFFSRRSSASFSDSERETIDKVLDYYGDKEPQWLSNLTHMEEPWRRARDGVAIGMPCTNIISKDTMQQYYGGL